MKKLVLTLIVCSFFAATSVFGQVWSGSSLNGNTYRNGKVAIGLTTPSAMLDIKSTQFPILGGGGENPSYGIYPNLRLRTEIVYETPATYHWDITATSVLKFSYFTNQQAPVQVLDITTGTMTYYGSKFVIKNGTTNELALYNDGRIHAREIEVNLDVIPDYVFAADYELMPLAELQKFINLNHHLPNIKSAEEYEAYGRIPLKELNLKLLEKVEELTLYTLEQENEIILLKQQMAVIQEALKAIQD